MKIQKNYTIELLRIIAIWAVVAIHTTSRTLTTVGFQFSNHAPFALIENQLFRFAVPLFFLISGYVLTEKYAEKKKIDLLLFYKKRFVKLFFPYFFWTGIYYLLINHNTILAFIRNAPSLLLYGSAADQLYFVPTILFLYILFPFLLRLMKKYPFTTYSFFYWIGLLISLLLLFSDYYSPHLPLIAPLRIALLNFPLFTIGILYSQYKKEAALLIKKNTLLIVFLLCITIMLTVYEGKALYYATSSYNSEYFTSQWRPSIFLYTIFLLGISINYIKIAKKFEKIVERIASLTFFVFFIHIIFIHVFWKILGAYLFSSSVGKIGETAWFDPLVFIFVILCSYGCAYIVSFIPKLRTILGITA